MGSSKRDVTVTRRSFRKKCVGCTRCSSCGSPNVTRWLDISTKENAKPSSEDQSEPSAEIALCSRCVTLRDRGNYCPLCNGCYEDDDYDSKMMECGRCGEWIHAHCESLNNEHYQILSFLPDTVEYVCRTCVLEASSNWLDAVNNELMAGCDAVIQALLSSKCAKHLVRREAQKFTNSLLTSPLMCLPNLNSSSMQKKAEIMEKGGSYLESINNSNQMVSDPSQCFFNIKEKLDTTGDPNIGTSVSNETQSLYLDKSISEGVTNVLENSIREGVSVDDQIAAVMDRTLLESIRHSVEENAILKSAMKVPEGGRCETGMMSNIDFSDRVSQLHSESSRVISSSEIRESQLSSENRGDMFGSDVTAARFEGDFYNDAKGEIREQSMITCSANDDSRTKLKRRSTRSSSSWATLGPPDIGLGPSADSIKLRECSVRLQDICKSRSASSSPGIPMDEESEDSETPTENQHPNLMPKLSPRTGGDSMVTNKETSMLMAPLDSRTKNVSRGGLQAEREQDRNLASGLHGLLTAKETDLPCSLGRDVSCTQVDGPNDETTTAAHVIRNLFYEERNLSMLDSANLLDKKSDVLNPEKKSSIKNSSLLQIENQLISPKDKITKDIDDDCVSSEASSYCDTDTEIESIQDDPEEPRDLLGVKDRLKEKKYNTVLHFHVDTARVIDNGRHLNRAQTRNVLATYAKHMKESFPWFDVKTANIFELVDKKHPFPVPHFDHTYVFQAPSSGSSPHQFLLRDMPANRKKSPLKGTPNVSDRRKCSLCAREGDGEPNGSGRLLYLGQDEWMHINCGLWSSEVYEEVDGGLQNVYLAVNRGRLVKCSTCQERGATVGCCHKTCQATYHFLCARESDCQFMEDKRIYCPVHMSAANGEEKSDDFEVGRCVYVDMDSEKKKWRQVPGNRVSIIIGSLVVKNLGRIVSESDSAEALIPVDFVCSRKYWSTVDPTKQVTYTCRTKKVSPSLEESLLCIGGAPVHRTIDHSQGEEGVQREMAAVKRWFKQLEESKVEKKSRETNIIPPHLCPLYRSITAREGVKVVERVTRCCTPPAVVESDVRQCIDDIIDKVSRSVEEESLLFDTDLPAIVSADDNELISMVLNDLDACDPLPLHSTPSTSGRPSPLDMDFLSTCEQMLDSGKVSHSGNLTQETVGNSQVMMDVDGTAASALTPVLHQTAGLTQPVLQHPQTHPLHHEQQHPQTHPLHEQQHPQTHPLHEQQHPQTHPLHEQQHTQTHPLHEQQHPQTHPLHEQQHPQTHPLHEQQHPQTHPLHEQQHTQIHTLHHEQQHLQIHHNPTASTSTSSSSSYQVQLPPPSSMMDDDVKESIVDTVAPPPTQHHQQLGSVPFIPLSSAKSESSSGSIQSTTTSSSSDTKSYSSSSSNSSSSTGEENSSPERGANSVTSNTSSPDSCCRPALENSSNLDSNSGSESSQSNRSIPQNSGSLTTSKSSSALKQICRVLPMPSTANSRRSSSASDHSDAITHDQSPPVSRRSRRISNDQDCISMGGRSSERKKICMKRNYKTVIKKYPLRSGMRKSKPYETVQIEINETIEIPREDSSMMRKNLKRKWSEILDTDGEQEDDEVENRKDGKECKVDQEGQEHHSGRDGSDEENGKENSVSKKVLKFSDDSRDITVSIVNNNNNLCEFSKSRVHKYRHKTVLQLDGAADGSSSSAEMSESQDEGTAEGEKSQDQEDSHSPPLHSALAMRIKEQSLLRSLPGEEGPYKCSKCKRLYRTKESYEKHIETCTFEVDSSSTSEEEDDHDNDFKLEENEDPSGGISLPFSSEKVPESMEADKSDILFTDMQPPDATSFKTPSHDFSTSQNISLIENIVSSLETKEIAGSALGELCQDPVDFNGRPKPSGEEPAMKKMRLESNLPRQPGVHRQVRTAIKKSSLAAGEEVELLQVVQGGPPGTDVFVPPPVSPIKFSPTVKKNMSPRRYSNMRLLRGGRNYQYRRAPAPVPTEEHHYQNTNSSVQMAPAAPLQVAMQPVGNTSAQLITPATPTPATFQQFNGQSSPYSAAPQLASPVTHLSPAMQMASPVTPQVAQQVSPQVNPQPQVLTMVSAPSVAVPQGYTLQYVGSFRDGEIGASGGSLVTYPPTPVVVPQPQLVVAPQQNSVVMPQVMNTNITYSFTTPETLVINQPAMVPGMQQVQYLHQQQPPQTQVMQQHPEQQLNQVMQYNQATVSSQPGHHVAAPSHHMQPAGQIHPSPCFTLSDLHNTNQICTQQQQQQAGVLTPELSFTGTGSKPIQLSQSMNNTITTACNTSSISLPTSSTISSYATPVARQRPQASVAPQIVQPLPTVSTATAVDTTVQETTSHSRLPFSERPISGVRTVATVAPAVITSTSVVSISTCSTTTRLTSSDTSPKVATVRPRPTYSYRDAMKDKLVDRPKVRQEVLHMDRVPQESKDAMKIQEQLQRDASDSESDSETDFASRNADKDKEDRLETQSYKLVLRKDSSASTGFNVLPISGPDAPLPSPEVKELRIKAKVSVGPKRKKAKSRDEEKDLILAAKDITKDLYVNEQLPNFSVNPMHNPSQDDPAIFEKPKTCSTEPYIVFELTSEDGFHVESRHVSEVWQKVFEAVSAARANMKMDSKVASSVQYDSNGPGGAMSGLHMLGLTHNAVQYLLEQLPGAKDCHKYSFQFHRRPQEEGAVEENPSGCARTESFKIRSPYDIFSWLASKHRRMPERSLIQQEEIQLSTTRRATSLELPMAMRYRHLRETAREAVGVFRSSIHGRGLFCKRDIDSGEMVIEYAGQVIRSSMCDMREKDYESKGIGCYMFRIDDDTVIDATMHGNAARFINHSCDPNCYSRVVDILGKKHIIIFALRRIMRGEELTYDYKFPIEDDKIPCTCGTRRCRKYLN